MKQKFFVSVHREKDWFVAQTFSIDVASQGATVKESLKNLKEAFKFHFEMPVIALPQIHAKEVEVVVG
ncbi:MAG: type II toxin-antitoxin system HicB family antitoxin [Chloroflexota bacterium]|nr:type II toxin-antitoxin system HicB family antitoxin [Chloroflexota bacterium]